MTTGSVHVSVASDTIVASSVRIPHGMEVNEGMIEERAVVEGDVGSMWLTVDQTQGNTEQH